MNPLGALWRAAARIGRALGGLMWNMIIFAGFALAGMFVVLSLEAQTGREFGEAEWGIINIVIGGILGYGQTILDMRRAGQKVEILGNVIVFSVLGLGGLSLVLSLEALSGAQFGAPEWGLINLVLGNVVVRYGGGVLELRQAQKEE